MPAARDVAPLHIVTVCVRGRDTYAKRPFGGPEAVLTYLACYTHRVAIANSRLVAMNRHGLTFRWKDYRARSAGKTWRKTMTLTPHEFIRLFLLHVLPDGVQRIRHYGILASGRRANAIARIQQVIAAAGQDRQGPGLGSGRIIRSGR
ncbi:MAG: transposase [Bosea sp.]|nr:transposase [Bosea sp. (in: a-proteobacteria)]